MRETVYILQLNYIGKQEKINDVYVFHKLENAKKELVKIKKEWYADHKDTKEFYLEEDECYFRSEMDSEEPFNDVLEVSIDEECFSDAETEEENLTNLDKSNIKKEKAVKEILKHQKKAIEGIDKLLSTL